MHFNRQKIPKKSRLKINPNISPAKKRKPLARKEDITPIPRVRKRKKIKSQNIKINNRGKQNSSSPSNYISLRDWSYRLSGHPAFILGNSPSINNYDLSLLNNYLTIGINRIFYIYDPTILIWQDKEVWTRDKKSILNTKSIKVCRSSADPQNKFVHFSLKMGWFKLTQNPEKLYGTGNTGALAIEFAVSLGCSSIVLLGTDCKYNGKKTDFYGSNPDHKPYTLKMCRDAIKWAKKKCPVPIYNCSTNDLWEKRSLEDVIRELNPPKLNREFFVDVFKR
jgi:hypothetical protein